MKVLFANVPFIKYVDGVHHTGPNAGSRWPWSMPGHTVYACFPFRMAEATAYLKANRILTAFYDGVALKQWDYVQVEQDIISGSPDIVVLEIAAPLAEQVLMVAKDVRRAIGCKIVLVGPHCSQAANELLQLPFVDHVVKGEYEQPCLEIARGSTQRLWEYVHLEDINFWPYRPYEYLYNYWEPTMGTPRLQLQVNTSRGCTQGCYYCLWPQTVNAPSWDAKSKNAKKGGYRARSAENVIGEIRAVCSRTPVKSILFDDDTFSLGPPDRIKDICNGLASIGLPWSMMSRIDIHGTDLFDYMVERGCVGMRFGLESFQQPLLDRIGGHRNGIKNEANAREMVSRYKGVEFHFTTMEDLPGETADQKNDDDRILREIKELGDVHGNRVHWQRSSMVAFPGTEMARRGEGTNPDFDGLTKINRLAVLG